MNPVDAVFQRLRSENRKAFIPFLTAGDPDLPTTARLLGELAKQGASIIEIGFPYSDPIADGPVIQASYTRALARGIRLDDILESVRNVSSRPPFAGGRIPLVGMLSYALVQRREPHKFLARAHESGLSGAIIPDLPLEEAEELATQAAAFDFKLIQLVTPTTPRERALRIAQLSTGFLYYVSITGITGERDRLPEDLVTQLRWLRGQTELPICVGFGISKPEHVRVLREVVDGIIVGSAFVRLLEPVDVRPPDTVAQEIGKLARSLADALNPI
jgi:tryptophan synthase alpha chain